MSGSSACLTLNIIQAIKLSLLDLPSLWVFCLVGFFFSYHYTHTQCFLGVWGGCFNTFLSTIFLPFCRCFHLEQHRNKNVLSSSAPHVWGWISSLLHCAGGWFLAWLKCKMLLCFAWGGGETGVSSTAYFTPEVLAGSTCHRFCSFTCVSTLASTTSELCWWDQYLALCVPANY